MKKKLLLSALFLAATLSFAQQSCDEAYSAAGYAYQHTKKALQANNDAHLKYYAERALEPLTTVNTNATNCGCKQAEELSRNAIDFLNKSLVEEEFDKIRYFVKRAKPLTQSIIDELDLCLSNQSGTYSELTTGTESLEEEEERLRMRQQRLLEEQRKLEAQLAEKKRLQQELQRQKQQELTQQLAVKNRVEPALLTLENAFSNLVSSLGCEEAYSYVRSYKRELEQLERESLNHTEQHYLDESIVLTRKLVAQLERCNSNETSVEEGAGN